MKLSTFVPTLGALAVGGALFGALAACDQPLVSCTLARGDFAVKYRLVAAADGCATQTSEVVGVAGYNAAREDGNPDLDALTLAFRSATMGGLVDRAAASGVLLDGGDQAPNAFGKFDGVHPTGGVCAMTTLTTASLSVPALPAVEETAEAPGDEATPATAVRYTWQKLRVEVTAAAAGTLFTGTVTIERDACKATYEAVGIYPAVPCANEDGAPDDALCAAVADPDAGISVGSGINPDYPVACDPASLMCVYDAPSGRGL